MWPPNVLELFSESFAQIRVLERTRTEGSSHDTEATYFLTPKTEDSVAYWQNRWTVGQSQWHSNDPNHFLVKYCDKLKVSGSIKHPSIECWNYYPFIHRPTGKR